MAISSNLAVVHCPICDRAILASSTRCQFCGAEVTPVALPPDTGAQIGPIKSQAIAWQDVANIVCSWLWIGGSAFGALSSLTLGPFGLLSLCMSLGMVWVGFGLLKQQWLSQMIGKGLCALMCVYSVFSLIGMMALRSAKMEVSPAIPLFTFFYFAFNGYIIWCVSDS